MKGQLFVLVLLFYSTAFGAESIGKVTDISGTVKVSDANQKERLLKKRSAIYLNDTIKVEENSKVEVKFTDGSVLNLSENSIYRIDSYQYRSISKPDSYTASLLEGGFRLLTGSIGKKNPDQYSINTPSGVIGVRGTILEATIVGDAVFFGCESGQAIVCNEGGCEVIGVQAVGLYCVAYSSEEVPQLLLQKPKQLEQSFPNAHIRSFQPPPKEESNQRGPLLKEGHFREEAEEKHPFPEGGAASIQSSEC